MPRLQSEKELLRELAYHRENKPDIEPLETWDANTLLGVYRNAVVEYQRKYREWKATESELVSQILQRLAAKRSNR